MEITKNEKPFKANRDEICLRRHFVEAQLKDLGVWHNPSNTNFLFVKSPQDMTGQDFFKQTGVFVRDCRDGYDLPGYWRVSCGSQDEMTAFVDGMKQVIGLSV